MTSPTKFEAAPYFKLRYSKKFVVAEFVFLVIVFASMVKLLSGIWLAVFILLFVLMSIRFFTSDSIIASFPAGSSIQIRSDPNSLIWYDQSQVSSYTQAEVKILMTRWFILLQLGRGKSRQSKLLLSDSFADINHYTYFRRQLIETYLC